MNVNELPPYVQGVMTEYNLTMEEVLPVWKEIEGIDRGVIRHLIQKHGEFQSNIVNRDMCIIDRASFRKDLALVYPLLDSEWANDLLFSYMYNDSTMQEAWSEWLLNNQNFRNMVNNDSLWEEMGKVDIITMCRFLSTVTEGCYCSYDMSLVDKEIMRDFQNTLAKGNPAFADYANFATLVVAVNHFLEDMIVANTKGAPVRKFTSWRARSVAKTLAEFELTHVDIGLRKRGLDPKVVRNIVDAINLDVVDELFDKCGHDNDETKKALIKKYPILKNDEAMTLLAQRMALRICNDVQDEDSE